MKNFIIIIKTIKQMNFREQEKQFSFVYTLKIQLETNWATNNNYFEFLYIETSELQAKMLEWNIHKVQLYLYSVNGFDLEILRPEFCVLCILFMNSKKNY